MNNRHNNELGNEKISSLLFRMAVPAITAQIINLLYNLVDRMYIGHIEYNVHACQDTKSEIFR